MEIRLENVNIGTYKGTTWVSGDGRETWSIRHPWEKLLAKYEVGTTLPFDWYIFGWPHHAPNQITPVDVAAADRLMNAQVSRSKARTKAVYERIEDPELQKALEEIPINAGINDQEYFEGAVRAIEALVGDQVRLAIASKLLTIKRPYLIPMLDSVVATCFGSNDPGHLLRRFKEALNFGTNPRVIADLGVKLKKKIGFAPSPVRILDQLIWFDWNLVENNGQIVVRGFDDWTFDPKNPARGVARE